MNPIVSKDRALAFCEGFEREETAKEHRIIMLSIFSERQEIPLLDLLGMTGLSPEVRLGLVDFILPRNMNHDMWDGWYKDPAAISQDDDFDASLQRMLDCLVYHIERWDDGK